MANSIKSENNLQGILIGAPRWPPELVPYSLSFLPGEIVGQSQFVCKQWLNFCDSTIGLRQRISLAWAEHHIRLISNDYIRNCGLLKLAGELISRGGFEDKVSSILTEVKEFLSHVQCNEEQERLSKASIFFKLVELEASYNLQDALKTIELSDFDPVTKDKALGGIVEEIVEERLIDAELVTLQIIDEDLRETHTVPIVKGYALFSLPDARVRMEKLNRSPFLRCHALLHIAQAEMLLNPIDARITLDEVRKLLPTIQDSSLRDLIADRLTSIESPEKQDEAQIDTPKTLRAILTQIRNEALAKVKAAASHNLSEAKKIALLFPETDTYFIDALLEITRY